MQNRDIEFKDDKAILSRETYEEWRMFCRMHGETDLPPFPLLPSDRLTTMLSEIEDSGFGGVFREREKEVKKLTDE